MKKKYYRYFSGLLSSQEKWLNKMSACGHRLIRTGKSWYEFEECEPNKYRYCVEFIGEKSKESAEDYKHFLEDMGYVVFYKNLNLQWSVGKVRGRPWAQPGGRVATKGTTLDKELLIVEKINDGKPFELHTTLSDRMQYTKQMQKPWLWSFLIFFACSLLMRHWLWIIFSVFYFIPTVSFQLEILRLKKDAQAKEW